MTARERAYVESLLEGIALPAAPSEVAGYARRAGLEPGLVAELEAALTEAQYESIDAIGEAVAPAQPLFDRAAPPAPAPESGSPPGGEAYTELHPEPEAVRPGGP